MSLCDWQIKAFCDKENLIEPFIQDQLQPASYDMKLGNSFSYLMGAPWDPIDSREEQEEEKLFIEDDEQFIIEAGGFVLGSTYERVNMPDMLLGRIEGKSSIGRLGLMVHLTAGFIDPGFKGNITLEIHNVTHRPWLLRPKMMICQMAFTRITTPSKSYNGKYQESIGTIPSRSYKDV
jgi:dCTP deaminase